MPEYTFNLGSFFLGILLIVAGGLIVIFYKPIADNIVHGVSSYDKTKFFGIGTVALGFLIMTNLHVFLLNMLVDFIFPKM